MKAEYINPFIQGAQTILSSFGESTTLGGLALKQKPYSCEVISISIGIKGDINGNVIFNMNENIALKIASKMMFGMPVQALDDMSKSALSELGNMISGTVATLIASKGISVDITPPIFNLNATEATFAFIKPESKIICIPLKFTDGNFFKIDILIME